MQTVSITAEPFGPGVVPWPGHDEAVWSAR
jgi:hypothetical protein